MARIARKTLDGLVDRLNTLRGTPMVSYREDSEGIRRACVGNYHISSAYGGYALHQMSNESGGVRDVFYMGHVSASELYNMLHAYIKGLEDAKELI